MSNSFKNYDNKKLNILDKFSSNEWLFEQIFGDKSVAMYDLEKEKLKNLLIQVYWFTDIEELFPPEIDLDKINNSLKTMFRFNTFDPNKIQQTDVDDIEI